MSRYPQARSCILGWGEPEKLLKSFSSRIYTQYCQILKRVIKVPMKEVRFNFQGENSALSLIQLAIRHKLYFLLNHTFIEKLTPTHNHWHQLTCTTTWTWRAKQVQKGLQTVQHFYWHPQDQLSHTFSHWHQLTAPRIPTQVHGKKTNTSLQ